jgi:hypothetical protein
LADSGTNFTLFGSLKIAAAIALQKSTSRPAQRPCASGRPKPASVPFEPQLSVPRCFTVLRADAAMTIAIAAPMTTRFMVQSPTSGPGSRRRGAIASCGPVHPLDAAITERRNRQVKGLRATVLTP